MLLVAFTASGLLTCAFAVWFSLALDTNDSSYLTASFACAYGWCLVWIGVASACFFRYDWVPLSLFPNRRRKDTSITVESSSNEIRLTALDDDNSQASGVGSSSSHDTVRTSAFYSISGPGSQAVPMAEPYKGSGANTNMPQINVISTAQSPGSAKTDVAPPPPLYSDYSTAFGQKGGDQTGQQIATPPSPTMGVAVTPDNQRRKYVGKMGTVQHTCTSTQFKFIEQKVEEINNAYLSQANTTSTTSSNAQNVHPHLTQKQFNALVELTIAAGDPEFRDTLHWIRDHLDELGDFF
eukprot:TRINITY_DN1295_c0_g1_i1.p1 TRINITY_DN1295_c0_g1~~TRINITY_DN1295_c0_g1_i1.p1  ORF type:complete len:295 (-),score=73.06 TRINITY_DN1295_c0_g1_i1:58-942(-)